MKTLNALGVPLVLAFATSAAYAQNATMMNGGGWGGNWMGGYGGFWMPILVVVVVGLIAWIVMRKNK